MQSPRRFLPSLSLLCAFEAAARTGSITAAAKELSLTQSAVSRQIRALEEQLEVELFHRERQSIRLTPGGETYAREVRDALRKIGAASLNLRANPFGGTLTLGVLPTFGARWLTPRLPRFLALNPGITVHLLTRANDFDFDLEPIDAAVRFGDGDWAGTEAVFLRAETVVPACSPAFRADHDFRRASDLGKAPLLHMTTRPDAWEQWLAHHGVAFDTIHGMLVDQFAVAAEAAVAGLGVALLPEFLIEEELRTGRLVLAIDLPMRHADAYHLVWPRERASHPPLHAFRAWILAETADDRRRGARGRDEAVHDPV
jgi:LysR family glycine cleavage system transcriptional activator